MPILNDTPVVIPAIQSKTFNELFIYNLIVHAPSISSGKVKIELLPFDSATGELGPFSEIQTLETEKLWTIVAEVPEVAAAFGAIINAIPAVKQWIANQPVEE